MPSVSTYLCLAGRPAAHSFCYEWPCHFAHSPVSEFRNGLSTWTIAQKAIQRFALAEFINNKDIECSEITELKIKCTKFNKNKSRTKNSVVWDIWTAHFSFLISHDNSFRSFLFFCCSFAVHFRAVADKLSAHKFAWYMGCTWIKNSLHSSALPLRSRLQCTTQFASLNPSLFLVSRKKNKTKVHSLLLFSWIHTMKRKHARFLWLLLAMYFCVRVSAGKNENQNK